jgi:hypothetical protein
MSAKRKANKDEKEAKKKTESNKVKEVKDSNKLDKEDATTPGKDDFKELEELNSFGEQEDQAILGTFDGESLVKSISGALGKADGEGIKKDVKNGNPRWVKEQ